MFLIRLQDFDPLSDAINLLTQIANEADVIFSPSAFVLAASYRSRFVATLEMSSNFFSTYSVDQDESWRISLRSFHDAMLESGSFTSMTIHVLETTSRMILRFEGSRFEPPLLHQELILSPLIEENISLVDDSKFFSIDAHDFKCIIVQLSIYRDDPICVTLTNSQVKFSIATEEIILTTEGGHCIIVGYEGEFETQFQITLHPKLFFLDFVYNGDRVWFFKTIDSDTVIAVPAFGLYAQYVIYFPPM